MTRLKTALCIAALLAGGASPAFAQDADTRVVRYADLDLNRAAGADALIGRISRAARSVCGDHTGRQPLQEMRPINTCRAVAMEDAIEDVNNPVVTARYYGSGYVIIEPEGDAAYYDPYYDDPNYVGPSVSVKKK